MISKSSLEEVGKDKFVQFAKNSIGSLQSEDFLRKNEIVSSKCLDILKKVYDHTKIEESGSSEIANFKLHPLRKRKKKVLNNKAEEPLKNLITTGFDENGIWEEIQLQNSLLYENLVSNVSNILSKQKFLISNLGDEDSDSNSEDLDNDDNIKEKEKEGENEGEEETTTEEDDDDEKDIEMDNDNEKDLESENLIEDMPSKEEKERPKSNFELRKKKVEENIERLENEALEPKSWQLQGEITADKRPENSLLEEHLVFDHLIRHAPEVTPETTEKLEDIIKQRIKDKCFDDVERKFKPLEGAAEYKKKIVLDAEKSKLSLAQMYEQEYLNQKKVEDLGDEKEDEIPKEHKEIQEDMKKLFAKLDALSNFHYTPKAPQAEIKVITNLSSICREEVAPISVSDANLLAPQEIEEPAKGESKGRAERSDTDRKRERRLKKKNQKIKKLAKEERAKLKGLGVKKIKLADDLNKKKKSASKLPPSSMGYMKELKSSKAFFSKLEEQVKNQIQEKTKVKKMKNNTKDLNAKKFKM